MCACVRERGGRRETPRPLGCLLPGRPALMQRLPGEAQRVHNQARGGGAGRGSSEVSWKPVSPAALGAPIPDGPFPPLRRLGSRPATPAAPAGQGLRGGRKPSPGLRDLVPGLPRAGFRPGPALGAPDGKPGLGGRAWGQTAGVAATRHGWWLGPS